MKYPISVRLRRIHLVSGIIVAYQKAPGSILPKLVKGVKNEDKR
jgi:hypothetical protein